MAYIDDLERYIEMVYFEATSNLVEEIVQNLKEPSKDVNEVDYSYIYRSNN